MCSGRVVWTSKKNARSKSWPRKCMKVITVVWQAEEDVLGWLSGAVHEIMNGRSVEEPGRHKQEFAVSDSKLWSLVCHGHPQL